MVLYIMETYLKDIEKKIKSKINLEEIKVIDNSHRHKNHKSFQKNKLHLILEIRSKYLSGLKRLDAERLLISTIKNDFEKNSCLRSKIKTFF